MTRFGLSQEEFEFICQTVVMPLEKHGALVWCFGSRARGDYNRFSDLDLMVEAQVNLGAIVAEILEQLIESNFPFKIDLVELRHFAQSYCDSYHREKVLFRLA